MGVFRRISDIVSANLNDLVEGYEDPEKMLRQAIREMETAIANSKRDVAKAMANEKTLAKELASNDTQAANWSDRAEQAVDSGDDELALKALTRKKEYERIAAALRDQHDAAQEASQTLRRQLEAMQAKQKDAERRLGTLAARKQAADVRAKMAQAQGSGTAELDKDAFNKFDRLTRKVEMAEAEAEAMSELARSERATDDSADEISDVNSEAQAELMALKRKRKGS